MKAIIIKKIGKYIRFELEILILIYLLWVKLSVKIIKLVKIFANKILLNKKEILYNILLNKVVKYNTFIFFRCLFFFKSEFYNKFLKK